MTSKNFYSQVMDNLEEGYSVKMVSKQGFNMEVSFSHMDETGEPYYVAVGIEGSEFAQISGLFTTDELKSLVISGGFELYK